jgi:hypothetical protein
MIATLQVSNGYGHLWTYYMWQPVGICDMLMDTLPWLYTLKALRCDEVWLSLYIKGDLWSSLWASTAWSYNYTLYHSFIQHYSLTNIVHINDLYVRLPHKHVTTLVIWWSCMVVCRECIARICMLQRLFISVMVFRPLGTRHANYCISTRIRIISVNTISNAYTLVLY